MLYNELKSNEYTFRIINKLYLGKYQKNRMVRMKKKFFTKKKIIIGAVVIIIAVGGIFIKTKTATKTQGVLVTTAPVTRKDITDSISLKAPLEGTESAEIVSKLHYKVIQLDVKEGDKVTKGQVLAVLDSDTLRQDIKKAEDDISLSILQNQENNTKENYSTQLAQLELVEKLKDQQKAYEKALADLETTKRIYENTKILSGSGAETQEALKNANTAYNEAQRVVKNFNVANGKVVATAAEKKAIETAAANNQKSQARAIEIAKRELERKKKDLEECQIKSPIDGTITRVNIKLGRFADETDNDKPMFVVENIDNLQMKVMVSEYDIGKIKPGQSVSISADILQDKTVSGLVTRISPSGEEKAAGSTERVIPTLVEVQGDKGTLIAGINAKAKILIAESKDTLTIPLECVMENPDGTAQVLRVNKENLIEVVPIEVGVENDIESEIKGGKLSEKDKIVLSPTADLKKGTLVTAAGL